MEAFQLHSLQAVCVAYLHATMGSGWAAHIGRGSAGHGGQAASYVRPSVLVFFERLAVDVSAVASSAVDGTITVVVRSEQVHPNPNPNPN